MLFSLVRSSLPEELNGNTGHATPSTNHPSVQETQNRQSAPRNAPKDQRSCDVRLATPSQVKALYAIARSRKIDSARFLMDQFQVRRAEDLCLKEASLAIDELKRNGGREG